MQPMIAVRMRGISKRYFPSGIRANDEATLEVERGSIHAIVGENGAGKTTLMKILAGLELPDAGTIEIEGKPVHIQSPAHARELGIGMVHQHFLMFDDLTTAENIFFGLEPLRVSKIPGVLGILDRQSLVEQTRRIAADYGFVLDPMAQAGDLSISARQQVAILRQLARNLHILILDEPTSVLTEQETTALFEKLAEIRRMGHTIIIVTHKIDEVMRIADRVTVMRQGKTVGTYDIAATTANELACLIMGTNVCEEISPRTEPAAQGPVVFQIEGLSARGHHHGETGVTDLHFAVHAGEVLGVCALSGNGLAELEDALGGFLVPSKGFCIFDGSQLDIRRIHEYRQLLKKGAIGYLPSDRMRRSMALSLTVRDNFMAVSRTRYFHRGWLESTLATRQTQDALHSFDISAQPEQKTVELSGGNIQKLAIARLFSIQLPKLLILCEPTWGLDIKSTENVHRRILDAKAAGSAILILSSDVDEILALADSIMVLYRGRAVLLASNSGELNRERIGEYLLGARSE